MASREDQPDPGADPPVGWAQHSEYPPGYRNPAARPGARLWVLYLVLFLIGVVLSIIGSVLVHKAPSPGAATNATSQHHLGDVLRTLGFIAFLLALLVGGITIALRTRARGKSSSGG